MKKSTKIVAEICLYGITWADVGAGWIAEVPVHRGKMFLGNCTPVPGRSFTEAIYEACRAVRTYHETGKVKVYEPTGELVAETDVCHPCYFGDLKWSAAPQYVLAVEELLAVAERPN
jgi:hypothetical protein